MFIFLSFLAAVVGALLLTPLVKTYALSHNIVDNPLIESDRRMHTQPTALLGGLAVWLSITLLLVLLILINPSFIVGSYLKFKYIIGIIIASMVLMVGGYLDDRYHLRPSISIWFPIIAALVIIASGAGINFVTRPWGGVWRLDGWKIELLRIHGLPYYFNVWADLLAFCWLMGMMYTTKLLDGLDGLTSGVSSIGALTLTALSLTAVVHQPDTARVSAIVAGAFLGFLYYNWFPARIFLGEGGSLLAGFMLGVLAIVAGGKIATTFLVIGLPAFDVAWVVLRRLFWDKVSLARADRQHLHFRLLDIGLTPKQTVWFFWSVSAVLGMLALVLQTRGKFLAILFLVVVSIVFAAIMVRLSGYSRVTKLNA